jgi:hypothetical protein
MSHKVTERTSNRSNAALDALLVRRSSLNVINGKSAAKIDFGILACTSGCNLRSTVVTTPDAPAALTATMTSSVLTFFALILRRRWGSDGTGVQTALGFRRHWALCLRRC